MPIYGLSIDSFIGIIVLSIPYWNIWAPSMLKGVLIWYCALPCLYRLHKMEMGLFGEYYGHLGSFLLNMDYKLHTLLSVRWNYGSIPKLQRCNCTNRWIILFHTLVRMWSGIHDKFKSWPILIKGTPFILIYLLESNVNLFNQSFLAMSLSIS